MRVFYDTEFRENGHTIDLISIGMVAEDGREYYAVNLEMPEREIRADPWLMENVVPGLPQDPSGAGLLFNRWHYAVKWRDEIANEVAQFITATPDPELWAWYGAYDHVVLAQLWGRMIDLPAGVPMWTNDLRQEAHRLGNPTLPEQAEGVHNALADARHNLVRAFTLDQIAAARS